MVLEVPPEALPSPAFLRQQHFCSKPMSAFRSPSRWSKKMVPGPMVPEVHPKALLEPTPLPKQQASSKPMPVPRSPGRGARKNGFRTDGARSAPRGTSPTDLLSAATILFKTDVGFQVARPGVRKNGSRPDGARNAPRGPSPTDPPSEAPGLCPIDACPDGHILAPKPGRDRPRPPPKVTPRGGLNVWHPKP